MQNLVSLDLTADDLAALDGALATIESLLGRGVALTTQQRRDLYKMGDKSEAFCRQSLRLLANNPQVVPPGLGLEEAQDVASRVIPINAPMTAPWVFMSLFLQLADRKKPPPGRGLSDYTVSGLGFSTSSLYCLIALATSLPVIFRSAASAAMAGCAMCKRSTSKKRHRLARVSERPKSSVPSTL